MKLHVLVASTLIGLTAGAARVAFAQVPYDPPTSVTAAPNVFLVMDATRTTLITGESCEARCHMEARHNDAHNSHLHDPDVYMRGETRLQLARRVLTGGWGWGTSVNYGPSGGSADADIRRDGIMDQYPGIRWGLVYYDGLGARLVLNPTGDNRLAQQSVIDFGQPGFLETVGHHPINTVGTVPHATALNSWLPMYRTTQCCAGPGPITSDHYNSIPWYEVADEGDNNGARQARALRLVRDYLREGSNIPQWVPPDSDSAAVYSLGGRVEAPNNANVIASDPANVLVSAPPAGCRRNFTIMLLDGHGSGPAADTSMFIPLPRSPQDYATDIARMGRHSSPLLPLPTTPDNLRNQLFAIHFGSEQLAAANNIADVGYDGIDNGIPTAYEAAPGGVMSNLSALYAAFAAIFQLILDGDYLGAPPTITRQGDVRVTSTFTIQDCTQARPDQCNIGRIGHLVRSVDTDNDGDYEAAIDFGEVLRSRLYSNRRLFTSYNIATNGTNCGAFASCASRTAALTLLEPTWWPGSQSIAGVAGTHHEFMYGNPNAEFANGVARGDTRNNALQYAVTPSVPLTNPYKLVDIANSRPVVVGAPTGIGEDITRWTHFRNMQITRLAANGGDGAIRPISERDEVVYIGGNDGFVHAFLSRRTSGTAEAGRTTNYNTALPACAVDTNTPISSQNAQNNCLGIELWGYTPRLLHNYWGAIRGGHYFMVDGTPIISDVLFTKGLNNPPAPAGATACTTFGSAACTNQWEYRTVMLQCLGGGGPGCFALDVTNPYDPRLLWERELSNSVSQRGSSTSRPQIVRMRRTVSGVAIPYYVALMGGGLGEAIAGDRRGTFMGIGVEDGQMFFQAGLPGTAAIDDFASAPSCLDTDNDSFTDTCYITTTNASVYKIRFANGDPSNMTMALFFDARARLSALGLPGAIDTPGVPGIRSYGRIVAAFDRSRDLRLFYATGNFENVQNTAGTNYFFELTDAAPEAAPGPTATPGSVCNVGGTGVYQLPAREKVIFDPVIANGTVLYTSYAPDPNPCLPGDGYLYGLTYDSCSPGIDDDSNTVTPDVARVALGDGLPSSPVVNERTGVISVGMDNGVLNENAGRIRRAAELPVSKLWWRVVR